MSNYHDVTVLFQGQGTLQAGAGESAFINNYWAKQTFYEASVETGEDLAEIAFGSQTDRLKEFPQTIRTAASIANLEYAVSRGLWYGKAAGHSVGQLAAFHALGAFDKSTLFKLTHAREECMRQVNEDNPGVMIVVTGLTRAVAKRLSQLSHTYLANINASNQHVFSGKKFLKRWPAHGEVHLYERVTRVAEWMKSRGLVKKYRTFQLGEETGDAHTPGMADAVPLMQEAIDSVFHKIHSVPPRSLLANSLNWIETPEDISNEILRGLTTGVDWEAQMAEYYRLGYRRFVEPQFDVDPDGKLKKPLTGLIERDYKTETEATNFGEVVNITIRKDELKKQKPEAA